MKNLIIETRVLKQFGILSITLILLLMSANGLNGQPLQSREFVINDFVVKVTRASAGGDRDPLRFDAPVGVADRPDINGFSGKGVVILKSQELPVTFNKVKLKYDRVTNKYVAVNGLVKGVATNTVTYDHLGFKISINWKSVVIDPENAFGKVAVRVPLHSCSTVPNSFINMTSPKCELFSNGSLNGRNFSGSGSFDLKKSVYRINIYNNNNGVIALGKGLEERRVSYGASLDGTDSRGLFEIDLLIKQNTNSANVGFRLINPLDRKLEYNAQLDQYYFVRLMKGIINYNYNADTLTLCSGEFSSLLKVPDRYDVLAEIPAGTSIDTFNLALYTNETNALYDSLNFADKNGKTYLFNMGAITIEPKKYGAWVYFDNWIDGTSKYSKHNDDRTCDQLAALIRAANDNTEFRYDKSPGVTIIKGNIFLKSPQVDYPTMGSMPSTGPLKLKSVFSGALTLTPFGLFGKISSNGNTFIPDHYPIEKCVITETYYPSTWEEIIDKGDNRPDEVKELFTLQNLKIREMKLIELNVCNDRIVRDKAIFTYWAHFPFPSYLDLEFEDKTFTSDGMFHKAYGPILNKSIESVDFRSDEIVTDGTNKGKTEVFQIPGGHIFWAWRLPVTFADKGVVIDYSRLSTEPEKGISISMVDTIGNNRGEIYSSELSIPPLYSGKSAFRKGVRFSGYLTREGDFLPEKWDKEPFFGKSYSKKFKCDLKAFNLAPAGSSPTQRAFDFKWEGGLHFPFFTYESKSTWKHMQFQVKDIIPFLPSPYAIDRTTRERLECENGDLNGEITNERLTLKIDELRYDHSIGGFIADRVRKNETGNLGRLELFSYAHCIFLEYNPPRADLTINTTVAPDCNTTKTVIERMKGAIRSDQGITDLVCYDPLAVASRSTAINSASCCSVFYYGTYQIITKTSPADSTITFLASNVKYYPYEAVNKLSFENSKVEFRSDDTPEGNNQLIDIPTMQLALTDHGYYGAFGTTFMDEAFSLPYEGEFRFFLDPHCGYFYMLGAGTFTYAKIPLSGQLFLFHTPRATLNNHPFSTSYSTTLLQDMAMRSLSPTVNSFLEDTQLDGMGNDKIITGFLTSGSAKVGIDCIAFDVSLRAGFTNYFYHSTDYNTFRTGMFGVAEARASLDLLLFSIEAKGGLKLALTLSVPMGNYNSLYNSIRNSDLAMRGDLWLEGCLDVFLVGHCCGGFKAGATISTQSGLNINSFGLDSCCDCNTIF